MSVPHLDLRLIDGDHSLLFGPYAGFSPRFLKAGSMFDLPLSVKANNLGSMLGVARTAPAAACRPASAAASPRGAASPTTSSGSCRGARR